jgi:hypothetical protein
MDFLSFGEMSLEVALMSTTQTNDLKIKIDPVGKIMWSKSVELLINCTKSPYLAC